MERSTLARAMFMVVGVAPLPFAVAAPAGGEQPFVFRDVARDAGLLPHLAGIRGHAAGWGDADGDGRADLYVGTFAEAGAGRNVLLLADDAGRFQPAGTEAVRIATRASASLFVDLDNDGDLDLYVSSMPAQRNGITLAGCTLFRNDGGAAFTNVSEGNGACPPAFGGRSAAALDFDGDGLLDLAVGEDPLPGYNGSATASSRLFRNLGGLRFEDATSAAGLPAGVPGYGVAAADVNGDAWPDLFIAANDGGNRLFLNDGKGKFREAPGSRQTFAWPGSGNDNMVCGVCFGDVNRDGRPDLALGPHFKRPWIEPQPIRLFLNRGGKAGGDPVFEEVTQPAGLAPVAMKAPHIEIQDFDNDGWPDLYASVVKLAGDGTPHPLIYRNLGAPDGRPAFREAAWAVNNFPTAADQAVQGTGEFFDKMNRERKVVYTAAGPSCDYDRDGRVDLFLASWWPEVPSMLLRNETPGGNWLDVRVVGEGGDDGADDDAGGDNAAEDGAGRRGVNRMGVGSVIRIYPAGKLADAAALIGCREIAVGYGYTSGQEAVAHFGLGDVAECDVEVILPHGKGTIQRKGVKAGQTLSVGQ